MSENESEQFQTQRIAYLENMLDVPTLMEEAEKKAKIESENLSLCEELSKVSSVDLEILRTTSYVSTP